MHKIQQRLKLLLYAVKHIQTASMTCRGFKDNLMPDLTGNIIEQIKSEHNMMTQRLFKRLTYHPQGHFLHLYMNGLVSTK